VNTPDTGNVDTIDGGITAAEGFRAAAVSCGIKTDALDLALIVSDVSATAAGLFTTNRTVAAPVVVCREHLERSGGIVRAVAVNSGCANACTGPAGLAASRQMAEAVAAAVTCPVEQALVASTGVIGLPLEVGKIRSGITAAAAKLDRSSNRAAAVAIMTTDPAPKETAVRVRVPAGSFVVGGMVKGSGMIEPRMATMLGFLTTDVSIDPVRLRQALVSVTDETFNAITVDGECSTNDSVFLVANGASGVEVDETVYPLFVAGLKHVCSALAREIVRGGEGATKLVTIHVTGAGTLNDAKRAARAIANSPLVKTAIHGADPNWGRLVAVAGRAGVAFEPSRASVRIGPAVLYEHDTIWPDREPEAASHMLGREIEVEVNLGTDGEADATVLTCDLSAEYVRINADYRT
jgi:glutamate N-acetyltransferase/amino-acid N-acetyltransferase